MATPRWGRLFSLSFSLSGELTHPKEKKTKTKQKQQKACVCACTRAYELPQGKLHDPNILLVSSTRHLKKK